MIKNSNVTALFLFILCFFSPVSCGEVTGSATVSEAINNNISVVIERNQLQKILDAGDDLPSVMFALKLLSDDAKRKGQPSPKYNLCLLSSIIAKGKSKESLLCANNKGIPRIKMPQIAGIPKAGSKAEQLVKEGKLKQDPITKNVDLKDIFIKWVSEERGHTVFTAMELPASSLKATQNEIIGSIVADMWWQLKQNPNVPLVRDPIFISKDYYILDGHHRWAAIVASEYGNKELKEIKIPVQIIDIDIIELVKEANEFVNDYGILPHSG